MSKVEMPKMPKVRPGATLSYILIWLIHHYKPILS